jgi:hypothetical protein
MPENKRAYLSPFDAINFSSNGKNCIETALVICCELKQRKGSHIKKYQRREID